MSDYALSSSKPRTVQYFDSAQPIAVLTFAGTSDAPTAIIWARLASDDTVAHGLIQIDSDHPERAASEVNRILEGAIVRRKHIIGPSPAERFFHQVGVVPSWYCLKGLTDGIEEALTIHLPGGCSFKPQHPISRQVDPLEIALEWIENICSMRRFFRSAAGMARAVE